MWFRDLRFCGVAKTRNSWIACQRTCVRCKSCGGAWWEVLVVKMYLEGVMILIPDHLRIKTTRRLIKIRVSRDSSDRATKEGSGSVSDHHKRRSLLISPLLFAPCAVRSPFSGDDDREIRPLGFVPSGRSRHGGFNDCHRVITGNVSDRAGSDLAENMVVRVKRVTMMMFWTSGEQVMTLISAEGDNKPCSPRSSGFTSRSSGYAVHPSGRAECSKFEVD